jgi:periplasmic protein TonB
MVNSTVGMAVALAAMASSAFGQTPDSSLRSAPAPPAAPPPATAATSTAGSLPPLTNKDVKLSFWDGAPKSLRFYPEEAQRLGITGSADAECLISADLRLTHCKVLSERPATYGFGKAAIGIFSIMDAATLTKDGTPTAGRLVDVHFDFR